MNKTLLLILLALTGLALVWGEDRDHQSNMAMNRPDVKVFQWGENRAGDCHQLGATLEIRPNGMASFHSEIWSRTHGTDVWHSVIHLFGPGGELGNSGNHDSPGIPHDRDGPEHKVRLDYNFNFPPDNFGRITVAVEHSGC